MESLSLLFGEESTSDIGQELLKGQLDSLIECVGADDSASLTAENNSSQASNNQNILHLSALIIQKVVGVHVNLDSLIVTGLVLEDLGELLLTVGDHTLHQVQVLLAAG